MLPLLELLLSEVENKTKTELPLEQPVVLERKVLIKSHADS